MLGFHGCDEAVGAEIVSGKTALRASKNDYDWLGGGIYFWENNPSRAKEFVETFMEHPERSRFKITTPFVIGAVIDLGRCLNLLETDSIMVVKEGYQLLKQTAQRAGYELPKNKKGTGTEDLLLRYLDCAVIETVHKALQEKGAPAFDSVRAAFQEGSDIYENAGFKEKNHIQICVRNPNCIKGYFHVREPDVSYVIP